ncbi:LytR/AlgR family response regulator transcription factor [Ichthyenterobacterium magnum]|uniref:LytTr DNA-binding domain-containing protein n=1 Tax=Ichthyenterobacterium magnum TaxID=1230530 RepID=A0A420DF51_9FLAO|nr:LytTR family DNA-binding domain-containing protein [Ichthyenterobacterium magnum]RKE90893.1 LytTr DNA-binding domain-containing protein [Ichthyenterobacterium magnum]
MFKLFKSISNSKQSIIIIALVLTIAIIFETFQQLYYIKRFTIADDVTFFSILKNQSYRWIIWMLLSFPLIWYIKSMATKIVSLVRLSKLLLVIFGLVFINIIIISISQIYTSGDSFSLLSLFLDYAPFFMYQKAPIYTLGYIAIAIISYLFFINEKLQIEVQELAELKLTNKKLYTQLSSNINDEAKILNIKIGNKRKIIPVENICWIEADDYCVKVHTTTNETYTMRSSLKALDEKLSHHFLRVHRKAIVNMKLAKELNLASTPNLILKNNTQIQVSKSNLKTVKDFLN